MARTTPAAQPDRPDGRADSRRALLEDVSAIWARLDKRRVSMDKELGLYLTPQLVELMAFHISRGETFDVEELLDAQGEVPSGYRAEWAALLASVLMSRGVRQDLAASLLKVTALSAAEPELRRKYCDQLLEHLLSVQDFVAVRDLLSSQMQSVVSRRLVAEAHADLTNPFFSSVGGNGEEWDAALHDRYARVGLSGVSVTAGSGTPFSRLTADRPDGTRSSAKVTVAFVSDGRAPALFVSALRSLQEQSWRDLDLLVIDTSGTRALEEPVQGARDTDSRVRYEHVESHGEPHRAIARALEAATGEYLTWQRDTQWSHHERIRRQVEALEASDGATVVVAGMWNVTENLSSARSSDQPMVSSTWMARTGDVRDSGGVLAPCQSPLEEMGARILALTGRAVIELDEPLVVRCVSAVTEESDCIADVNAIADAEWEGLVRNWHQRLTQVDDAVKYAVGTLRHLNSTAWPIGKAAGTGRHLDVLMVGDWHSFGGPQLSMLAEIKSFVSEGKSVGVMHLQPVRFFGSGKDDLCAPVCDLILGGVVELITPADHVRSTLTVVRYPPVLAFGVVPTRITQDKLIVLANQAPSERDGSDIRYRVEDVRANVAATFGATALWAPQGPQVRDTLTGRVPSEELLDVDLPGVIDTDYWKVTRTRFRGQRPIIGRHSRDTAMKWPSDRDELLQIYPDNPEFDVRIMGGAASVRRVLGENLPTNWLAYARDQLPVRTFLSSLDFFVYYQHPDAVDAFGRAVLEALAAGCVVILPPHMRPVFGDAAVYVLPDDVRIVICDFYASPHEYFEQSARAVAAVEGRYSLRAHAERVATIAGGDS